MSYTPEHSRTRRDSQAVSRDKPTGEREDEPVPPPLPREGGAMLRIDSPHQPGDPHGLIPGRAAGEEPRQLRELQEQLDRQGEQLAAWLDARHGELDHREQALNQRQDELESDARAARFWYDEQQREMAEREAFFAAWQRALERREQDILARERGMNSDASSRQTGTPDQTATPSPAFLPAAVSDSTETRALAQQAQRLRGEALTLYRDLLAAIERRRLVLEDEAERGRHLIADQGERLARLAKALRERERGLIEREESLSASRRALMEAQHALARERERLAIDTRAQRDHQAQEARRFLAERQAQQQLLEHRAQTLAQRDAAISEQLDELRRLHLAALQERLAHEELARQLGGLARPQALAEALSTRRAAITDHYRLAAADLAHRRRELEELAESLAREEDRLTLIRREAQEWLEARMGRMKDEG